MPPTLTSLNINREVSSSKAHSLLPGLAKVNHGFRLQRGNIFSITGELRSPSPPALSIFPVVEQRGNGPAFSELLLDVGDEDEPDHLCLGNGSQISCSCACLGQREYKWFSEPSITQEGNISLHCIV